MSAGAGKGVSIERGKRYAEARERLEEWKKLKRRFVLVDDNIKLQDGDQIMGNAYTEDTMSEKDRKSLKLYLDSDTTRQVKDDSMARREPMNFMDHGVSAVVDDHFGDYLQGINGQTAWSSYSDDNHVINPMNRIGMDFTVNESFIALVAVLQILMLGLVCLCSCTTFIIGFGCLCWHNVRAERRDDCEDVHCMEP